MNSRGENKAVFIVKFGSTDGIKRTRQKHGSESQAVSRAKGFVSNIVLKCIHIIANLSDKRSDILLIKL